MKINFLESYEYDTVEVDLTNTCNLRCILCYRSLFQNILNNFKLQLSASQWINIFNKYKKLKKIVIAGVISEPTLHPEIIQLIDYFVKRNI